jgi:hypothetical protein
LERLGLPASYLSVRGKAEDDRLSMHHSDERGGAMATTMLSTQTISEMVQKLGGLALSPSEIEGLAPQLATLFRDIQTLESLDLGEVEPETLFDIQGE